MLIINLLIIQTKNLSQFLYNMIKNTYILIPSRIGSTRLKNKPLIDIDGKSIIQRAITNALSITKNAYVATDSDLIKSNVEQITNNGKMCYNKNDYVDEMLKMKLDINYYKKMSDNAKLKYIEKYDFNLIKNKIINIVENI